MQVGLHASCMLMMHLLTKRYRCAEVSPSATGTMVPKALASEVAAPTPPISKQAQNHVSICINVIACINFGSVPVPNGFIFYDGLLSGRRGSTFSGVRSSRERRK